MIRELLMKTFIPDSRGFDAENDIHIFSWNFRKSSASRENKRNIIIINYKIYQLAISE